MDIPRQSPATRGAFSLLAAAIVLLPLVLLFDRSAVFSYDWHNHQWMVGYFGEYFRQHHRMPDVLNVPDAVGMPQPVFYGVLLYPMLGLVSALTGAALALRLGALAALTIQFVAVYAAGVAATRARAVAGVLATVTTWSVYALTNLYNRSALTEFFGVAFLNAAVAFGIAALAGRKHQARDAWLAGMLFVLAVGSHPPTALIGSGFVGLLLLIVLPGAIRSRLLPRPVWIAALGAVVAAAVILAPWVYANVHFRGALGIVGKYPQFSVSVDRCDSWLARFAPFPYDPLSVVNPHIDTPYIEAPMDWSLALLAAWNLILVVRAGARAKAATPWLRVARVLGGIACVWLMLTLVLSMSPAAARFAHVLAPYVQFSTRFVSHANLALLVMALASGGLAAAAGGYEKRRTGTVVVLAVAALLSLSGVVVKLNHAAVVRTQAPEPRFALQGDRSGLVTAGKADAAADYATIRRRPHLLPGIPQTVADLTVGTSGPGFGVPRPVTVTAPADGWLVTNIVVFPWNVVRVDGRPRDDALVAGGYRSAFRVAAGSHEVAWAWSPDPLWRGLMAASRMACLAVLVGTGVLLVAGRRLTPDE